MEKKMENLSDEMLEQVSGGGIPGGNHGKEVDQVVIRRDGRGNPTHWQSFHGSAAVGQPFHYVCPHCGRLLHEGAFGRVYCDPCDEGWFPGFNVSLRRDGIYPGC